MNPVQVIGDADTVLAFALGGVPGRIVHSAAEAEAAVAGVVRDVRRGGGPVRAPALVLVPHRTAGLIRQYLARVMLDASGPLVLEIPGFGEPLGQRPLHRFVQRALGVRP